MWRRVGQTAMRSERCGVTYACVGEVINEYAGFQFLVLSNIKCLFSDHNPNESESYHRPSIAKQRVSISLSLSGLCLRLFFLLFLLFFFVKPKDERPYRPKNMISKR